MQIIRGGAQEQWTGQAWLLQSAMRAWFHFSRCLIDAYGRKRVRASMAFRATGGLLYWFKGPNMISSLNVVHEPDHVKEFLSWRTESPYGYGDQVLAAEQFFQLRDLEFSGVCLKYSGSSGKRGIVFTRSSKGFFLSPTDLQFLTQSRFFRPTARGLQRVFSSYGSGDTWGGTFASYTVEQDQLHFKAKGINLSFKIDSARVEQLPLYEKWRRYYDPSDEQNRLLRVVK